MQRLFHDILGDPVADMTVGEIKEILEHLSRMPSCADNVTLRDAFRVPAVTQALPQRDSFEAPVAGVEPLPLDGHSQDHQTHDAPEHVGAEAPEVGPVE